MPYEYGQIILVPVADGRGNVEPHPAVILSPSDQIVPGASQRSIPRALNTTVFSGRGQG